MHPYVPLTQAPRPESGPDGVRPGLEGAFGAEAFAAASSAPTIADLYDTFVPQR